MGVEMHKVIGIALAAAFIAGVAHGSEESVKYLTEVGRPGSALKVTKDASNECTSGGIIKDDNSFENGLRIPFVGDARFVQLLQPTSYPSILDRVCVCWSSSTSLESMNYNLLVYDDNGSGGQPGTFLGGKQVTAFNLNAFTDELFGYECSDLNVTAGSGGLYVGVQWNSASEFHYFLCTDESTSTPTATMYTSSSGGTLWTPVTSNYEDTRALGIRAHFTQLQDPDPPAGPAITSSEYPDFRFWVRIGDTRSGTKVTDCLPETVCVAGAIPTRAEVFVRIVGPKPNGYLWPNVVKFNTTKTEVWIQQISTGVTQYYLLPALPTDSDTLPGVVDKTGFLP
jgi:hypothetical protein